MIDLGRADARPRTLALAEALRDVLKNEAAWAIIQDALDDEYDEGVADGRQYDGSNR